MSTSVTTESWTTSEWNAPDGPPVEHVVAIRVAPKGPTFFLDDFRDERDRPKRWIIVGRRETCDLILNERTTPRSPYQKVNRRHCMLGCATTGHVVVKHLVGEGKNRTKVNRSRLHDGRIELRPGDVLELGNLRMVALSRRMLESHEPPRPRITAASPGEFFRRAIGLIGTPNLVATLFKIPGKTLWRWLRDDPRFRDTCEESEHD